MSKIIYHKGTNTYFSLDDNVVVIDINRIPDPAEDVLDTAGGDIAERFGVQFDIAYVSTNEAILLNELAIKSEADAWLDVFGNSLPEEVPAFRWAASASAEELEYVAERVYSDEYLWEVFTQSVRDAIRETWAENIEGDSK